MSSSSSTKPQPIFLIHGGAWSMPDDAVASHERGVSVAPEAGWSVLSQGGTAIDAVEVAVTIMEADDTFDAGCGSFLTRDGRVQPDALLMNGADLRTGGVACVERIRNPIKAARLVLEICPHVDFIGSGAERFAAQHGVRLVHNTDLIVPRERDRLMAFQRAEAAGKPDTTFSGGFAEQLALETEVEAALHDELRIDDPTLRSHDTVGAAALDKYGSFAAGTSTRGTLGKPPDASATAPSSAAASTPTTNPPPSPSRAGASRL
jgi:L-asparaginase / beta-aspartyl-peptidase